MSVFKFSDYDCIGFDLDSTVVRYNITNLVQLEYDVITDFLVQKKSYDPKYLKEPLSQRDFDFLQKGLFFDFDKGNILKLNASGDVHAASHGTKFLSAEEIEKYYPNREWEISRLFSKDPLISWNGPLSLKIRTLLDCFDVPAGLVFARVVDSLDKENNGMPLDKYNIWPDILDAFCEMYTREQLPRRAGNFYSVLQDNPGKYIHKCDPMTLDWIRKIKEKKKTFLITGSNFDFASVTAGYAFGKDWESLFDIIVCYAKKPGFFTSDRPFYSLKNDYYEDETITSEELRVGGVYNQGNWKDLSEFFSRITRVSSPKCLYVGDNMLQDIYAPHNYTNCDTMLISEEQLAEGMIHHDLTHNDEHVLTSKLWGSFFSLETPDGRKDSFWNHIIKKNSKICVPKLEMIISKPLDEPLKCFAQEDDDKELNGYHPAKPVSVTTLN